MAFDAVVLAGGRGRRLGGVDKAALDLAGRTSLDRVLDAVTEARRSVVVGAARPCAHDGVLWTREHPRLSGPASALRAGIARTGAPLVVALAVDAPLITARSVQRLLDALGQHDGVLLVDVEGHDQPLAAAYRRRALAGRPGRSLRAMLAGLDLVRLEDVDDVSVDVDTEGDLARMRGRLRG